MSDETIALDSDIIKINNISANREVIQNTASDLLNMITNKSKRYINTFDRHWDTNNCLIYSFYRLLSIVSANYTLY